MHTRTALHHHHRHEAVFNTGNEKSLGSFALLSFAAPFRFIIYWYRQPRHSQWQASMTDTVVCVTVIMDLLVSLEMVSAASLSVTRG